MKLNINAFDRDLALFDASATLTYFRLARRDGSEEVFQSLSSTDLSEVRHAFPRLTTALSEHLIGHGFFSLLFFSRPAVGSIILPDWSEEFKCTRLYFISSQKKCPYQPGTMIELESEETISLQLSDLDYGLIGISRALSRLSPVIENRPSTSSW